MFKKLFWTIAGVLAIWLFVIGVSIFILPVLTSTMQDRLVWAFEILIVVIGLAATIIGIWKAILSWNPKPEDDPWAAPLLPSTYVPRNAEIAKIKDGLGVNRKWWERKPSPDIIGIYGMGGCGKSTLMKALLGDKKIKRVFKDGFLLADLGPDSSFADLENQMLEWAQKQGVSNEIKEIKTAKLRSSRLRDFIRDQKILIILDNVWDVGSAKLLLDVRGPKCQAIVISRREELLVRLNAYLRLPIQSFSQTEAITLVENILKQPVGRDERKDTLLVLERVGYLPIAVKLLAQQRIQGHPWHTLFDRIKRSKKDPIQECFRLSYDNLDNETLKRSFRLIGILPSGIIFHANEVSVLWGSEVPLCDVFSHLCDLASASLVTKEKLGISEIFSIHPLLHDYAIELLEKQELLQALWAHADYYINLARKGIPDQQIHSDQKSNIFPHITAILQRALRTHKRVDSRLVYDRPNYCRQILCDLSILMSELWQQNSLFSEWEYWTKEAIKVAKTSNQFTDYLSILYTNLSAIHLIKHSYREAGQAAYKGWLAAIKTGKRRLEAAALGNIGKAHLNQNNYEAAYDCLHQAIQIIEDEEAHPLYPDIHSSIGEVFLAKNEYEMAFKKFKQAIKHRSVYSYQIASDYSLLGFSAYNLGELSTAFEYCQQAVCICFSKGSRIHLIDYLENLTMVLSSIGKSRLVVRLDNFAQGLEKQLQEKISWFRETKSNSQE